MNRLFWCVLAMFVALGRFAHADEVSTYAQIKPSLALIGAGTEKNFGLGTAFCVEDADGYGFLLTNKHVVGNDPHPRVLLMSDPHHIHYAAIVRAAEIDAVVLAIHADCQPVSISGSAPAVGTKIALAGFPAFQLSMFERGLGLSPSFHEGTISSVVADGAFLEYDAQTDHGNSGSPLFDVETGQVYGLVTAVNTGTTGALQNNIAIGSVALEAFLQNAHHDIEAGLAAFQHKSESKVAIPRPKPSQLKQEQANAASYEGREPPHVVTHEEQRCLAAAGEGDARTLIDACNQAQANWDKQRETGYGTPQYYDATLTMAYYVGYAALGYFALQQSDRGTELAGECKSLLSEVIIGNNSTPEQVERAKAALDYFMGIFTNPRP
jgi:Trypsin-like peptidase domain